MRRITKFLTLAAATTLLSCRDGVPPFTPEPHDVRGLPRQLTFSAGNDRDPVWTPDGGTIVYHAEEFVSNTRLRGVILDIPPEGGTAQLLLADVQNTQNRPLLATPAISPDGSRVAYFDLILMSPPDVCDGTSEVAGRECPLNHPQLDSAVVRVRSINSTGPIAADPMTGVLFHGPDPELRGRAEFVYSSWSHPYQQQFAVDRATLFRPTWSPDGQRVAYSDGLRIHLWTPGQQPTVIPGTQDGVSPAWSPDGQWIAFTRLVRTDSTQVSCNCAQPNTDDGTLQRRMIYTWHPELTLVRPDGSELVVLGAGEDPAWSPDGSRLYFRGDDQIMFMPSAGGTRTAITGTGGGRSPAVSPDGRWLAFARRKPITTVDYDIWVIGLSQ